MNSGDIYLHPDADDPVLENGLVLELIGRHGATGFAVQIVDETGGEARAYLCEDVVLKTQRPHRVRSRTSLEKEALVLEQIRATTQVPVPQLLGYGRDGDIEYEVLSRIPGVALRDALLSTEARVLALREVGAALRQIHEIDQSVMIESGLIPGDDSPIDVARHLRETFEEVAKLLADDEQYVGVLNFDRLRTHYFNDLEFDEECVTLHSNPGPEHCFVTLGDGQFSGLIDFGDAYRSHPALDVRSGRSLDDSCHILAGYTSLAPVSDGFLRIWRAGIVATQLRHVARGHVQPTEAAITINELATR